MTYIIIGKKQNIFSSHSQVPYLKDVLVSVAEKKRLSVQCLIV